MFNKKEKKLTAEQELAIAQQKAWNEKVTRVTKAINEILQKEEVNLITNHVITVVPLQK